MAYKDLEKRKAYMKAYRQTPKYKDYMKTYNKTLCQTPEHKDYMKTYRQTRCQTPEYKAKAKAYRQTRCQTPEYKAYNKTYNNDWRKSLPPSEVARRLKLPVSLCPPALIEAKRKQLLLHRELKKAA